MNSGTESDNNLGKEDKSIGEYKELGESYISQQLYQENLRNYNLKNQEILMERYKGMRSDLYNTKKTHKDLVELNIKLKSDLYQEENNYLKFKNENTNLKKLLDRFKSRKVIKFTDMTLKILRIPKSLINKVFKKKISSKSIKNPSSGPLKEVEGLKEKKMDSDDNTIQNEPKKLKDIKVAVILDEFSYNSYKYEFNALAIEPDNWREIFETETPDLFFCESAWHGADSDKRPWKGKIDYNLNNNVENRLVLLEILKFCGEHGIPTVFWNKEDPSHYHDEVHSFAETASHFDHVFTSAEECVPCYKKDYGLVSVHSLMFAAQPRLFNPVESGERSELITFAGSWYKHHTDRSRVMEEIFENILKSGHKLKIYDRNYYKHVDDSFVFPEKYTDYINPSVSHDEIFRVYKESKYALNINTVTDSDTMFARRAFELMLCNTLVLSNYSKGLYKLFKDNVVFVDKNEIDLSNTEEKRIQNLYDVLKNHTYTNRFKQILDTINFQYIPEEDTVTVYYTVKDEKDIENSLKHYETLNYPSKEVAFFLDNETPTPFMNKYKQYMVHPLNYVTNQLGTIKNNTPYYIFATQKLEPDFIEKAVLHYTYIQKKFGIKKGNKFTFQKTENTKNTLFTNENFTKTLNNTYNNKTNSFKVYNIKI